jgi:DNA polymerase I-like protein with 3'-5' exonuclease and polymerase domains
MKPSLKINFNYEYITEQEDLQRVKQWVADRAFFVLDLETDGFSPFRNKIIMMQIGDHEKQWLIDMRAVNVDSLSPIFADPTKVKLGQNIKFDMKFLMYQRGMQFQNVADTMIAEQVLRCGLGVRVNMADLAEHYLHVEIDKSDELRASFGKTSVGAFTQRQLEYAAGDCIYPVYIAREQKPLIHKRGLRNTLSLEHAFIPVLTKMELAGIRMDTDAWLTLYQEAVTKRTQAEKELDEFFQVQLLKQEEFFDEAQEERTLNYGSWQQVLAALKRKGYDLPNTRSDTFALAAIKGELPMDFVRSFLVFRIYDTRVNRYGLNFLKGIEDQTGHIHSDFTQCFTTTGRLSSGLKEGKEYKVNLQNIPRDPRYRACFLPDEGYVFIIYDLQAIEPRVLGDMSLDPTYMDAFLNNKDIYAEIGRGIYKEDVHKGKGRPGELRSKTKIGVLGTSYGTGKTKFHRKMLLDLNLDENKLLHEEITRISQEESDLLWEGIFESCPSIRESLDRSSALANPLRTERRVFDDRAARESYQSVYEKMLEVLADIPNITPEDVEKRARHFAKNRGWVSYSQTLNGRKRLFKVYSDNWWTEGRNHPIQGTAGGDVMKTAMVGIDQEIVTHGYDACVVNQVHDEVVVHCKEEDAEALNPLVKKQMEVAGAKFMRIVPCVAEGGIANKWEKVE